VLYPVLRAAVDLPLSPPRKDVRLCADEGCGWLFLDRSNGGKRHWCRMADCGNRKQSAETLSANNKLKAGIAGLLVGCTGRIVAGASISD
jgi:predicted RNA-binding Zn ribbon-like protein